MLLTRFSGHLLITLRKIMIRMTPILIIRKKANKKITVTPILNFALFKKNNSKKITVTPILNFALFKKITVKNNSDTHP